MVHWTHKIQHEHPELSSARILLDGLEEIYKAGKKEVEAENKRLREALEAEKKGHAATAKTCLSNQKKVRQLEKELRLASKVQRGLLAEKTRWQKRYMKVVSKP